ncbi:GspE/PulE family protein [Clostridium cellulovorans]|uniref:Type II secretion system protein E n=1 Tax=Clostridium cellulovorans (strain ATCC 35296 / DSM 3052 / OCM 3 / 743B) TaxID=573061 RepID=D9SLE1_CLOC7|nr:GspE/PulE family protein [Clostridium cellulovorans]ADL51657.1 type II secretion system protein E [Clostridium cellulovorans 743B]
MLNSKNTVHIQENENYLDKARKLLEEAIKAKASDIHLEPFYDKGVIRFRINGMLKEIKAISSEELKKLVIKLKVISNLDIDKKRICQDGKISRLEFKIDNDVRVSTVPTVFGEKMVLRLLDNEINKVPLGDLGISEIKLVERIIKKPHGIILITGPTGSGKSTTAFAMLEKLNVKHKNLVTIEDPVEHTIEGINQINVNTKVELGFSNILKNILRQDPDIIMVGEIRDAETATLAIRAAITGHLVISTLHTNDAHSTIVRLMDMKIDKYLISEALIGVISQRLVQKLCHKCKIAVEENGEVFTSKVYKAAGCPFCMESGFNGRQLVSEVLPIDEEFKLMITKGTSKKELLNYSKTLGFRNIEDDLKGYIEKGIVGIEQWYFREESILDEVSN